MSSALDLLVGVGAWALPAVWLPVLAWTLAALLVEAALRIWPGHPLVGLGVRRAMLWALPAGLLVAWVLPALLPEAAVQNLLVLRSEAVVLPTIEVGVSHEAGAASSVPLLPLLAGGGLLVVVMVGAVRLAGVARGLLRLRRLSAGAVHEEVQRETEAAARAAGVTREVRAVASAVPTVPFTFGWRRPVVVVPAGLDEEALRLVLAHEAAHIARGDFAAGVAERALTALFGWHPVVSALTRRIDLDRERATDASVLAGHPSRRRDYATLLLSFSRLPSPALALGVVSGSDSLTTRITDMNRSPLSPDRLRRLGRVSRLAGMALFLLAVGAASLVGIRPLEARAMSDEAAPLIPPAVASDTLEVFEVVEEMPSPVGGMEALMQNVVYPPEAKADGVEGLAVVRFVVDEEGATRDAECIRGDDERLCAAALAAVSATPFEAGRQRGRAVNVRLVLPVRFALSAEGE